MVIIVDLFVNNEIVFYLQKMDILYAYICVTLHIVLYFNSTISKMYGYYTYYLILYNIFKRLEYVFFNI